MHRSTSFEMLPRCGYHCFNLASASRSHRHLDLDYLPTRKAHSHETHSDTKRTVCSSLTRKIKQKTQKSTPVLPELQRPLPLRDSCFCVFVVRVRSPENSNRYCARRNLSKQTCLHLARRPAGESSSVSVERPCTESPAE
jgi:hypothetical protein